MVIGQFPAVQNPMIIQRREPIIICGEGELSNREAWSLALPSQRTCRHITNLQTVVRRSQVTFITFGRVDPQTGSGEFLTLVNLPPTALA